MDAINPFTKRSFRPRLQIPEIFGQAMSYEDQIHMLLHWVNEQLSGFDFASHEEVAALGDKLAAAIQAVADQDAAALRAAVADLENQIAKISAGAQIWDISHGRYTENQQAMRNTGAFLAVHAITCEQLASLEITVSELSTIGINCHGLAVLGLWLVDQGYTLPDRFKPYIPPAGETPLTATDLANLTITQDLFVKRSALDQARGE